MLLFCLQSFHQLGPLEIFPSRSLCAAAVKSFPLKILALALRVRMAHQSLGCSPAIYIYIYIFSHESGTEAAMETLQF